ncbi:MAG TPA: MMPL family transporter [Spirochaetota bacterium]|nr:MMPL family transporter [Spirochaetota bacterium]
MKKYYFLIIMALLITIFFSFSLSNNSTESEVYAKNEGELLIPQSNAAIAIVDIKQAGLSLERSADLPILKELHNDFAKLKNVQKVESLLNAFRVISDKDEIIVNRVLPDNINSVTDEYLASTMSTINEFPELKSYISKNQDTLIYYIYFSNSTKPRLIYDNLINMQKDWESRLHFDFTGRSPILAATESFLTKDIGTAFPVLIIMIFCIFLLFKNLKVIFISLFTILLSLGAAYGFSRFLGLHDSPLLLLIPVFGLGLLSDYLIHYFYHRLYSPDIADKKDAKRQLLFPLSLTAISTITGFLSLTLINGSGHVQLGIIIAFSIIIIWFGVFYWINYQSYPSKNAKLFPGFQKIQTIFFLILLKHRYICYFLILLSLFWGAFQLKNLVVEPYPIEQLPENTTIQIADKRINSEFYGTLPFYLEIDTGEKNGILKKSTLINLQQIHNIMDSSSAGYSFSLLTVLKRMHYYFMGSEETLLSSNEFDDQYDSLIEQYLLYFSSSVDPLEYESLLNNSYRLFSIKGLIYYRDYSDLEKFIGTINEFKKIIPQNWEVNFYGMASELQKEHDNLRNNWIISFLTSGFLIFLTVFIFYRKVDLALISLLPGIISMIISFGIINIAGISIDAFSIIFVAIITGLVVDYSIHTLAAINRIKKITSIEDSFKQIVGYSGLPVFLSFVTSLLSFMVLFISSFRGAQNLGLILITSLGLAFFLSLYLIPLIILPIRFKKES